MNSLTTARGFTRPWIQALSRKWLLIPLLAINAEDVRLVPGLNFMQIVFRLPSSLPAGTCSINVVAKGQISNSASMRIRLP